MKVVFKRETITFASLLAVVFIILVANFFGIRGINQDPISPDERTTIGHIMGPNFGDRISFADTWNSLLTYSGEHPPLYYENANIWGQVISYDYRILRVLSLYWGLLTIAALYRIGCDLTTRKAALWAIILLATWVIFHNYLHEMREYAALMFWTCAAWLVYMRLVKPGKVVNWYHLVVLGITVAAAMYSHNTAIFLFIAIGFYHLLFVPKDKKWWQISTAVVIGGMTYILWLPGLLAGLNTISERLDEGEPHTLYNPDLIRHIIQYWGNGESLLFLLISAVAIFASWRNERGARRLLFFVVIITLSFLALNQYYTFIKRLRYVLVLALPAFLLMGVALAYLARKSKYILPLAFMAVWIVTGTAFYSTREFEDAMNTLRQRSFTEYDVLIPLLQEVTEPGLVMVNAIYNPASIKDSKQGKLSIDDYHQSYMDIEHVIIRIDTDDETVPDHVINAVIDLPDFWFNYFSTTGDPQIGDFRRKVAENFDICRQFRYGDRSIIIHYVAHNAPPDTCPESNRN